MPGVALVGAVLRVTLVALGAAPAAAPAQLGIVGSSRAEHRTTQCPSLDRGFRPLEVTIPGVVGPTDVLALGRDRHGVPRTPPLTERGRWQLAWDRASGTRPGGRRGVVRFTAHTYPRDGSYGLALGNRLLAELRPGARVLVSGRQGVRSCYRVVRRVTVRADASFADYYSTTGRPRLAILVCSGRRVGPGTWTHRTIWYAVPLPHTDATT